MLRVILASIVLTVSVHGKGMTVNRSDDGGNVWYVSSFGAKGDGVNKDTESLQHAIDHCAGEGGGVVAFSKGTYLTGTLFLKSNVHLLLEEGAEIRGSQDKRDYIPLPQRNHLKENYFLIFAENAKNISITGTGIINGCGDTFWEEEMLSEYVRKPGEWRPSGMVGFVNCTEISLQRLSLINSPCYTVWVMGCDDVGIDRMIIRNHTDGPNTDGIDIDCCRRVRITNCIIEGGDDAIAIKSDSGRFGEVRPCEEIFVSGCILSSPPACGIRVGYEGDSPIRNCLFTNLSIHDSHHGINVISVLPDPAYPSAIYEGTKIEHIRFNQIRMERIIQPIYIWMGNEKPHLPFLGYMRDIHIADVCAVNCGNSFIGSTLPGNSIEGVSIDHVQVMAGGNAPAVRYANVWGSRHPSLLYIHNVKGLRLKRLSLCIAPDLKNWQHKLLLEDIGELICNDQITPKP